MIKLTEILQDGEDLKHLKKESAMAKKAAAFLLGNKGLNEPGAFILRIKEQSKLKDWVALYRTNSVLSGTPIFWINFNLPEIARKIDPHMNIVRVMTDNILHEWWHAICDALRAANYRNVQVKTKISPSPDSKEEDLAEKFIAFCGGDAWNVVSEQEEKYFILAIEEFNNLWQ